MTQPLVNTQAEMDNFTRDLHPSPEAGHRLRGAVGYSLGLSGHQNAEDAFAAMEAYLEQKVFFAKLREVSADDINSWADEHMLFVKEGGIPEWYRGDGIGWENSKIDPASGLRYHTP